MPSAQRSGGRSRLRRTLHGQKAEADAAKSAGAAGTIRVARCRARNCCMVRGVELRFIDTGDLHQLNAFASLASQSQFRRSKRSRASYAGSDDGSLSTPLGQKRLAAVEVDGDCLAAVDRGVGLASPERLGVGLEPTAGVVFLPRARVVAGAQGEL